MEHVRVRNCSWVLGRIDRIVWAKVGCGLPFGTRLTRITETANKLWLIPLAVAANILLTGLKPGAFGVFIKQMDNEASSFRRLSRDISSSNSDLNCQFTKRRSRQQCFVSSISTRSIVGLPSRNL